MLKLKLCDTALDTVTVKGVPAPAGVAFAGLTVQVGGAPIPQLRATDFAYPFSAVMLPLYCADEITDVVSDGLLTVIE
jgi:hypothetical protein